jgi:hypothetical protein
MVTLRIALATATTPTVSSIEEDLRELAETDPARADFLRARLAPLSDAELGGGWFSGGLRRFVTFEERCAPLSQEPTTVVVKPLASAAQRIAEQPSLAQSLNEDQLTRMLCALLIVLEGERVYADVLAPGGWGPKKDGLADFALSGMSEDGFSHGRRIVRGEAKHWRGPAWMIEGMQQIFATGNTGQELFLALIVYSKATRFEGVVAGVRKTLSKYGAQGTVPFATVGTVADVEFTSGRSVRIFKTLHREVPGNEASSTRTLFTIAIDVLAEPSRAGRQKAKHPRSARAPRPRSNR